MKIINLLCVSVLFIVIVTPINANDYEVYIQTALKRKIQDNIIAKNVSLSDVEFCEYVDEDSKECINRSGYAPLSLKSLFIKFTWTDDFNKYSALGFELIDPQMNLVQNFMISSHPEMIVNRKMVVFLDIMKYIKNSGKVGIWRVKFHHPYLFVEEKNKTYYIVVDFDFSQAI